MVTSAERRVSGVSERRRYYRGGRRLEDLPYDADPQARVNDFASELAKTAGFVSHSSLEWADCITREVGAVLSALKRLWP
jgi:hypothetical protein